MTLPIEQLNQQLLEAVEKHDVKGVTSLLDSGADANAMNDHGANAIHLAAQGKNNEIIDILISRKADVNVMTEDGLTALHFAARLGYVDAILTLIKDGADVNIAGIRYKRSAMHYAADQGHTGAVQALLKAGADKNMKDISGSTAFDLATKKGFGATAAALK